MVSRSYSLRTVDGGHEEQQEWLLLTECWLGLLYVL